MDTRIAPEIGSQALSESLKSGATLPATWYTSESIFAQEMRAIFCRYWQYACRMDEVAQPGDYLACRVGNVPVVVVRNRANEIAAFINVCTGRGNASTNIILPVAPDRTLAIYDFYFEQGMPEEETMVAFIDQVQQEDIVLCESVQRGLNSGFYDRGKLVIRYENGIQHFQKLVFDALTHEDRPEPSP